MSNLISRHFFEGHTVVHGPHRLNGPPRLQKSIGAIILNILKGRTYHKSPPHNGACQQWIFYGVNIVRQGPLGQEMPLMYPTT